MFLLFLKSYLAVFEYSDEEIWCDLIYSTHCCLSRVIDLPIFKLETRLTSFWWVTRGNLNTSCIYYSSYLWQVRPWSKDALPPRLKVTKVRHALVLSVTVCLDAGGLVGVPPTNPSVWFSGCAPPLCVHLFGAFLGPVLLRQVDLAWQRWLHIN